VRLSHIPSRCTSRLGRSTAGRFARSRPCPLSGCGGCSSGRRVRGQPIARYEVSLAAQRQHVCSCKSKLLSSTPVADCRFDGPFWYQQDRVVHVCYLLLLMAEMAPTKQFRSFDKSLTPCKNQPLHSSQINLIRYSRPIIGWATGTQLTIAPMQQALVFLQPSMPSQCLGSSFAHAL
jgi:hypothetical protein